jgi:ribonucleoside-diphosphate reductase alpha chain
MSLAQKYFRKAGVPKTLKPVPEEGVPEFLWRKQGKDGSKETTGEHLAKQVFDRMAGT